MEGNGVSLGAVETAPIPELVRLRGQIFRGIVKAPFVKSGQSVRGGLEIDPETGKLKCHECAGWFDHLSGHVHAHKMLPREYKIKHGLRLKTAMVSEDVLQRLRQSGSRATPGSANHLSSIRPSAIAASAASMRSRSGSLRYEMRNENGTCHAQVVSRIREIARSLGRIPGRDDLRRHGIHEKSLCRLFNVKTVDQVTRLLGLIPPAPKRKYSREFLIEVLRDFVATRGRLPSFSELSADVPSHGAFQRYFGTLSGAYQAAGLGLMYAQKCKPIS